MIDKGLISSLLSGASYSSLVAGILFLLWRKSQRDWEVTNDKLDKSITALNDTIRKLGESVNLLKIELAKHQIFSEDVKEHIKNIEKRVFQ